MNPIFSEPSPFATAIVPYARKGSSRSLTRLKRKAQELKTFFYVRTEKIEVSQYHPANELECRFARSSGVFWAISISSSFPFLAYSPLSFLDFTERARLPKGAPREIATIYSPSWNSLDKRQKRI
jgi:hypothetical protein